MLKDNDIRIEKAKQILELKYGDQLHLLGQGKEGVVFHDFKFVYKVFDNIGDDQSAVLDKYGDLLLLNKLPIDLKHIYCAEVELINNIIVLKYQYENSRDCINYNEEDAISILTEQLLLYVSLCHSAFPQQT